MYYETIFCKILTKSLLEQFLQDVSLLFVMFAFLTHRSTCWCLARYAFKFISSNFALLFQCLEHYWDPRMHVTPSSRILVFFLEPYNMISVRIPFQSLDQSGVMEWCDLFNSDQSNILNKYIFTCLLSSFLF